MYYVLTTQILLQIIKTVFMDDIYEVQLQMATDPVPVPITNPDHWNTYIHISRKVLTIDARKEQRTYLM